MAKSCGATQLGADRISYPFSHLNIGTVPRLDIKTRLVVKRFHDIRVERRRMYHRHPRQGNKKLWQNPSLMRSSARPQASGSRSSSAATSALSISCRNAMRASRGAPMGSLSASTLSSATPISGSVYLVIQPASVSLRARTAFATSNAWFRQPGRIPRTGITGRQRRRAS